MLVQAFNRILDEKYFLQDILRSVNSIDENIHELNYTINTESTFPLSVRETFKEIQEQYKEMIRYIQIPLNEICNYANGTQTDIDQKLFDVLNFVHVKLRKVISIINQDILNKITPWQSHMLIDINLENRIRKYTNLVGVIFLVLVVFLGLIPLNFLIFTILLRLCCWSRNKSKERY